VRSSAPTKPKDWTDNPPLLQSTLTVSFWEDLQQAGRGTSYCRALLKDQQDFEHGLLACGDKGPCVVQVMRNRLRQISSTKRQFTGPQLGREALLDFFGKDRGLPLGPTETLEARSIRGLSISPLPRAFLPENLTLSWGFEPHNAQLQTAVFSGPDGKVLALALVDGLYKQAAGESRLPAEARIRLFVRDPKRLPSLLPSLQSWAAADALGMNVDCSGSKTRVCTHRSQYHMPIVAYRLPCTPGKLDQCRLPVPKVVDSYATLTLPPPLTTLVPKPCPITR